MNGNDLNTQETKTETTMELARLVMLQLLSDGVITEGEYFKIRDKLIDESETVTINGSKYRVCSQWVPERIAKLRDWHTSL